MGESTEENARLEVCLALVNKFQAPADDMTDLNKLFIKTKELCVAIIPFLNGKLKLKKPVPSFSHCDSSNDLFVDVSSRQHHLVSLILSKTS